MTLEQLQDERNKMALQRSAAKDQIDGLERAIASVSFAIQVLEANTKKDEPTDSE